MSAQPYFRSRTQRRDRDAELERLVAAELDTLVEPPAPANSAWGEDPSAAERDFVELVRQWLERRPNKHQLVQLICDGIVPSSLPDSFLPPEGSANPPDSSMETSSAVDGAQPGPSTEPASHAAP